MPTRALKKNLTVPRFFKKINQDLSNIPQDFLASIKIFISLLKYKEIFQDLKDSLMGKIMTNCVGFFNKNFFLGLFYVE